MATVNSVKGRDSHVAVIPWGQTTIFSVISSQIYIQIADHEHIVMNFNYVILQARASIGLSMYRHIVKLFRYKLLTTQ